MQITNGGKPAEYFQQCIIMEEIIGKMASVIHQVHLRFTASFKVTSIALWKPPLGRSIQNNSQEFIPY